MRNGDDAVMEIMLDRYKGMVRKKAGSMFLLGAEQEDLIQEGMIGLFKAVIGYDREKNASFSTFAMICISRQMYRAIKEASRKKHLPLNSYISLCVDKEEEGESNKEQLEKEISTSIANPEQFVIDCEFVEIFERRLEEELSDIEKRVLELFMTGMGYHEIAVVLEIRDKAADNALQRAKAKVKKIIIQIQSSDD